LAGLFSLSYRVYAALLMVLAEVEDKNPVGFFIQSNDIDNIFLVNKWGQTSCSDYFQEV